MEQRGDLKSIPSAELLHRLFSLVRQSRRVEAELVAHIGEVDARRLYLSKAKPSMYKYCTEVLGLTESEAHLRLTAARTLRKFPLILAMLADGRLHVSGIERLAPSLTPENHEALLEKAAHKTRRQIEELVADLAPKPDAPAVMRKLPQARNRTKALGGSQVRLDGPGRLAPGARPGPPDSPGAADGALPTTGEVRPDGPPAMSPPARRPVVEPLGQSRYLVKFAASAELRDKLERLQALMRSSRSNADLGAVIEAAVSEKLERLEARRFGRTKTPRKTVARSKTSPLSRHVPAAVRRAVCERDGGQCTFVDVRGNRCTERHQLEFHHAGTPYGRGGEHSVRNIRLACKPHNQYLAELEYGMDVMERHRRPRDHVSELAAVYSIGGPSPPTA